MDCAEKRELQRKCTAAWEAYEEAVRNSGLSFAPGSSVAMPTSLGAMTKAISELMPGLSARVRAGESVVLSAASAAMRFRWEHLRASRELGRHLTNHRC